MYLRMLCFANYQSAVLDLRLPLPHSNLSALSNRPVFLQNWDAPLLMAIPLAVIAKTCLEKVLFKNILDKWHYTSCSS